MDWIKRNLYFVIGSVVALILMGLAGYYLYTKWALNNEVMAKLNQDYATLKQLSTENPHPGSGTVDNIAESQKQTREVGEFAAKLRKSYQPINPIPYDPEGANTNVTDRDFSAALSRTIHQLTRRCESTSVSLPPNYSFGFEAQRPRVTFAAGSPTVLAGQLGDIKAICDILIDAKVNSIDGLRRERVSTDDYTGPQNDYTDQMSVTNELAVLVPYEVSFRCFSSELANVLSGFAASPHAVIVKTLNVEPSFSTNVFDSNMYPGGAPYGAIPGMPMPGVMPGMPGMPGGPTGPEAEYARRYGGRSAETMAPGMPGMPGGRGMPGAMTRQGTTGGGTLGGGVLGGGSLGSASAGGVGAAGMRGMEGMPPVRPTYPTASYNVSAPQRFTALPTVLDEKPLKVTMQLVVVKLKPQTPAT